jgi:hypothetical protein
VYVNVNEASMRQRTIQISKKSLLSNYPRSLITDGGSGMTFVLGFGFS